MRILQSDLSDFIKTSLLNIRTGCEQALQAGLIVELPLHVDFSVEVVQAPQAVTQVTETEGVSNKTTETVESAVTVTRTEQAHEVVTNEAAVTDTSTTARDVEQQTDEGGVDSQITNYEWGEY